VPAAALALALASAALHALWNLLLARARDAETAAACALAAAVVVGAPFAVALWDVEPRAVPYLVAGSAFELAYFALLAHAYRHAELSVVYPLARGLAPVLVLVSAAALLGQRIGPGSAAGVVLVGVGVLMVRGVRRGAPGADVAAAVAIACCIAAYTLIDQRGIRYAAPVPYFELEMLVPAAVYLVAIGRVKGRPALRAAAGVETALTGAAMLTAYVLVLFALRLAPAAEVAATRETSVVIATALAAALLREHVGPLRLAGSAVVVAGVALVALG
jgi:drug/metabolite transporter (DMT)-like permease